MTRQESEDCVVPDALGNLGGTRDGGCGGGKAVPVDEADRQLVLPLATADNPREERGAGARRRGDLSPRPRATAPKASDEHEQVGPATMEGVVERLWKAFDKVEANRGAPGPDRQSVGWVREHLSAMMPALRAALLDGSYRPGDIRRVWIPKSGGGQRGLGIPNVVDRMVQEAVRAVLEPLYEPTFHPSSHGFRPGRGCQTAIAEARGHVDEGHQVVVDMDLEKFFDRVCHQRLMARLAQRVADRRLLSLIQRMLKAKVVMPDGVRVATAEGVPQGGPLSPLLSNIVLSELDDELARRGLRFVRYADDCNVYVRSERAGDRVMASVTRFIERRLRLKVNASKSAVARPETRHFLGYRLHPQGVGPAGVLLSERSEKRLRERIVEVTQRGRGQSLRTTIAALNVYLNGWLGHFRVCTRGIERVIRGIDAHVRRRLRAVVLEHWKTKRTMALRLIRLGVSPRTAWRGVYGGRKGRWALSHASAVERGLCNAYFAKQGLVTLLERMRPIWAATVVPVQLALPLG